MLVQQFNKPNFKRTKEKIVKLQLQQDKECWVCHSTQQLDPHHLFGAANRPISEKYGLVVWLCRADHTGNTPKRKGVHFNQELMDKLHEYGKQVFIQQYSEELFLKEFKGVYRL